MIVLSPREEVLIAGALAAARTRLSGRDRAEVGRLLARIEARVALRQAYAVDAALRAPEVCAYGVSFSRVLP